jgi:hypothetical protein
MIEVELFYYFNSETRTVRFSRTVMLSAAPFTGSYVTFKNDNLKVGEVTLKDGGGIEVIIDNDHEGDCNFKPDAELSDFIEEMKQESGWIVASNVKRRR